MSGGWPRRCKTVGESRSWQGQGSLGGWWCHHFSATAGRRWAGGHGRCWRGGGCRSVCCWFRFCCAGCDHRRLFLCKGRSRFGRCLGDFGRRFCRCFGGGRFLGCGCFGLHGGLVRCFGGGFFGDNFFGYGFGHRFFCWWFGGRFDGFFCHRLYRTLAHAFTCAFVNCGSRFFCACLFRRCFAHESLLATLNCRCLKLLQLC